MTDQFKNEGRWSCCWLLFCILILCASAPVIAQDANDETSLSAAEQVQSQTQPAEAEDAASLADSNESDRGFFYAVGQLINAVFVGVGHFCSTVTEEISQIEGDTVGEKWDWLNNRIQTSPAASMIWLLATVFAVLGTLFVLLIFYSLITHKRKKRLKSKISKSAALIQRKLGDSQVTEISESSISFIQLLKMGEFRRAEKTLLNELTGAADQEGIIMYLFACKAASLDTRLYESLVFQVFAEGLDSSLNLHAHIAQIGRLIGSDKFPIGYFPDPKKAFTADLGLAKKEFSGVKELGSAKTLLDLIRIHEGRNELEQTRHLMIEVLVGGSEKQREMTVEYLRVVIARN